MIGSAGSDDKVAFLKELGCFDVAFNYKKESTKEILVANPPDICTFSPLAVEHC